MSDEENNVTPEASVASPMVVVVGNGGAGNAIATMLPHLFKDIDFSTLNATIDALGKQSNNLDKDEKSAASKIVEEWNYNVVGRLNNHRYEMQHLVNFFRVSNYGTGYRYSTQGLPITGEDIVALAAATGTSDLYDQVLFFTKEVEDLKETAPERPDLKDVMLTTLERMKLKNDYDYADANYQIELTKRDRKLNLAWKAFLTELNTKDQVKEMLAKAGKYLRNVDKLINECASKTSLAKLNIQINSEAVRDSLRQLMDFTKNI